MKGFIEVKEKFDGVRILCPIVKISAVVEETDGGAFIETSCKKIGKRIISSGIYTVDSVDEIKMQLQQNEV